MTLPIPAPAETRDNGRAPGEARRAPVPPYPTVREFEEALPIIGRTRHAQAAALGLEHRTLLRYLQYRRPPLPVRILARHLALCRRRNFA